MKCSRCQKIVMSNRIDKNGLCYDCWTNPSKDELISKQKVKEAIEKCRGWEDDRNLDELKKELELE